MIRVLQLLIVFSVLFMDAFTPVHAAGKSLPGPLRAELLRVIDGDTILVRARVWVDQEITVAVRLRGIDAPERKGRCAAERDLARQATTLLSTTLHARQIVLRDISGGKYFGRVLATVETADGMPVSAVMLRAGVVRSYRGKARASWCGAL